MREGRGGLPVIRWSNFFLSESRDCVRGGGSGVCLKKGMCPCEHIYPCGGVGLLTDQLRRCLWIQPHQIRTQLSHICSWWT